MKRKITILFTLLMLVVATASAQYTTDGLYTIQCVGNSKYMTNPGSVGGIVGMSASTSATTQFYIIENTTTPGQYNILTTDQLYLLSSDGGKGVLIDNTATNRDTPNNGALINLIDQGANPYRFESTPGGTLKAWNGQRGGNTQVGMGSSTTTKYQWNLVRIGNLPAVGVPVVTVTQPSEGSNFIPGASVTLQATATADGATISSVEFLVDDVKVGNGVLNLSVYEYTWTASSGNHTIKAKATSSTAQVTTSSAVNIVVSVLPASVALTWPSTATTVLPNQQFTLKATASAQTGETITKVEFFEGTNLIGEGTLGGGTYNLNHYFSTIGTFSISAKVTDSGNNVVSSSAVDLSTSLTTSTASLYLNFESTYTIDDWTWKGSNYLGAGLSHISYDPTKARSEANGVLEMDLSTGVGDGGDNLQYQIQGLDARPSSGTFYVTIHYADDNSAQAPTAGPTLWSSVLKPTPGTSPANDLGTFTSKSWSKSASAMGADDSSVTIYPALRIDGNNSAGKMYFDDVVLTYDPNSSGYDNTAPTAPTNLIIPTVEVANIVLTWDEGMDVGYGIDSTYILRAPMGEAAPVLINQVGYSNKGLPAGLGSVGNWTVVGVVPLGTSTFTDKSLTTESETYADSWQYAVVHKDYAYNYSVGTTADTGIPTAVHTENTPHFICYGLRGAINLKSLQQGSSVAVYDLRGTKVFAQSVNASTLAIAMSQGVYIVTVDGTNKKVIVK